VTAMAKILLIGYGNPARGDDGIGPSVADVVESWQLPHVTVESAYQLTVEDAAAVAEHDVVLFVDASVAAFEPFYFKTVGLNGAASFSTHSVEPGAVMGLAQDLFGAYAAGYVLGVRGYEFGEFREGLSDRAAENLAAALKFLEPLLRSGDKSRFMRQTAGASGCP
jgi:hydrogenase maturation protease